MNRRPPRVTRTDTLLPSTTRCLSLRAGDVEGFGHAGLDQPARRPGAKRFEAGAAGHFRKAVGKPLQRHRIGGDRAAVCAAIVVAEDGARSEEHTSELQSLMRISYAVFCLKKKIQKDKSYHAV